MVSKYNQILKLPLIKHDAYTRLTIPTENESISTEPYFEDRTCKETSSCGGFCSNLQLFATFCSNLQLTYSDANGFMKSNTI